MKVTIAKSNALGETIQIEVPLKNATEWEKNVTPAFAYLDRRQFELNARILGANRAVDALSKDEYVKFRAIMAGLNNVLLDRTVADADVPDEVRERARQAAEASGATVTVAETEDAE